VDSPQALLRREQAAQLVRRRGGAVAIGRLPAGDRHGPATEVALYEDPRAEAGALGQRWSWHG
jgi:hypothetical protein